MKTLTIPKNTLLIVVLILSYFSTIAQNSRLITEFKQTNVVVSKEFQQCSKDDDLGNCVAIALIKCALGQYGSLDSIYSKFSTNEEGLYQITFNDGIHIQLAADEIEVVRELSGIQPIGQSEYYKNALILYASICRRILNDKQTYDPRNCIQNFKNAVEYLNSGYPTKSAHKLLGMGKEVINVKELQQNENAIIWCSAHAAYASKGIQDLLGKETPLKNKKMRNLVRYSKIKGAYKLTKLNSPD